MPLESATYIHDLAPANPTDTDGLNQAGAQIRLTKQVLVNTFPNVTGPVTATQAALNAAAGAFGGSGVTMIPANGTTAGAQIQLEPVVGSGSVFLKNTGTAGNPGGLAIVLNDATDANPSIAFTLSSAGVLNGSATSVVNAATIQQGGFPLLPQGAIIEWWGDITGPAPSGWAYCNGANGTPNLLDSFTVCAGLHYFQGQTGGAPSATVASTAAGIHSHGGATAAGGAAAPIGVTDAQGSHSHTGATGGYSLQVADLAPHTHGIEMGLFVNNPGFVAAAGTDAGGALATASAGSGTPHAHSISTDGNHQHNLAITAIPAHAHTISNDGNHAHNVTVPTIPPFFAIVKIMKL